MPLKPKQFPMIARVAGGVIIAAAALALAVVAKQVLVPIVIAVVLAYMIISLSNALIRIPFFGLRVPRWVAYLASVVLIGLVLWVIVSAITYHLGLIIEQVPWYQSQLIIVAEKLGTGLGFDIAGEAAEALASWDIAGAAAKLLGSLAVTSGKAILVLIYTIFIILEYPFIKNKLRFLFREYQDEKEHTKHVLSRISQATNTYFRIKTIASFLTGLLCYIILVSFGVDFAIFWALLIFLLNFIPTIGSIVGVAFPAALALVQFASLGKFIPILALLVFAQLLVGNGIEPRIAGKQLDISPLVILVALVAAGAVWGVVGMIVSVPFIIILKIVAAEFPRLRPLSILLSRNITPKDVEK